ncbi:MAG TPA: ATP-dependent DNA helicase RecG, partial [Gammaproteobacteria bacterium]|nr:ATP-dependent DNA helicase RecG [Gammaproteobacteria bacterium]
MTALSALKGVGPQLSNKLQRLQLYAVTDLLFHLPIRYQDRTQLVTINQLIPATEQLVEGTITGSGIRFGKRRSLLCTLEDQTGSLTVRLFHFNKS